TVAMELPDQDQRRDDRHRPRGLCPPALDTPRSWRGCTGPAGSPAAALREVTDFLRAYGHRGVAEIDVGLPRWGKDPTHILGVLANCLRLACMLPTAESEFISPPGCCPGECVERGLLTVDFVEFDPCDGLWNALIEARERMGDRAGAAQTRRRDNGVLRELGLGPSEVSLSTPRPR
ncbi:MAG: hypothetical protein ACRDIF_04445, partial [Actinomycetota bacterium]